jgi:hypothetical protein
MPFPETKEALEAAGYVFDNEGRCRGCGAPIEWWITPNGKKMPMIVIDEKDKSKSFPQPILRTIRRTHFSDCEDAAKFRRPR